MSSMTQSSIGVVGDGGWGTAMAMALFRRGHAVSLWGHEADYLDEMAQTRRNRRFLPEVRLPDAPGFAFEKDLRRLTETVDFIFVAVPTQFLRATLKRHWPAAPTAPENPSARRTRGIVSLTKGVEAGSLARPSEIIADTLAEIEGGPAARVPVAVLSGPSHAEEVARSRPTTLVAASSDAGFARAVQALAGSDSLRVYTTDDVVGVELAAAVKNVIALAAGMVAGLELGDNALAALVTRGIAEMTRLGVAAGARAATFAGLAGMGDAIVTCYSGHGRNRAVGIELGRGRKLADILAGRETVAEGVASATGCRELAARLGVEMPITEEVCRVLFEGRDPRQAVTGLMTRDPRAE